MLMESSTEGPCLEDVDLVRKDISEGYPGLPMRLSLLVVDEACAPIKDAKVKIWHTQISGSYSGAPPTSYPCLLDPADVTKHYFRGVQTTNAEGRVDFDSCFPGWYPVRAIHIHFTVTVAEIEFTSQWGFAQELVDDIYQNQPEYAAYGSAPVNNAEDGILVAIGAAGLLDASRQEDGALLASTVVVLPG
jgi:protocatechuate 3,4-dioxygenase beta subunit